MPSKLKLPLEEIVRIVRQVQNSEISVSEASRIAGVHRKTMQGWIARYEVEGIVGFLPRERNRVYLPEVKESAVQDYLFGKGSLLDICKKQKVNSEHG